MVIVNVISKFKQDKSNPAPEVFLVDIADIVDNGVRGFTNFVQQPDAKCPVVLNDVLHGRKINKINAGVLKC